MSRQELSLQLSSGAGPGDLRYWIALEQIKEPELATFEEAAEVLDEAFELDPCVPDDEKETLDPEDEPSRAEKIEAAKKKYWEIVERLAGESDLCKDEDDGFTARVKLTRSHQALPYTLLPQNCRVLRTIVGGVDRINRVVAVQDGGRLDEKLPADQAIAASWDGAAFGAAGRLDAAPEIKVDQGRVWWRGRSTGAVRLVYDQPYDLLEIETADEDAALTALFRLSADRVDIEPPPDDDKVEELCESISAATTVPPEEGDCIAEIITDYHCDCSGELADTKKIQRAAPCPEDATPGDFVTRGKASPGDIVHRERHKVWVDCNEKDEVNDPAYYEQKCCEPPPFALPECKKKYREWGGKGVDPELKKQILRTYGPKTKIIMVGPDPPPCGTLTYEQDVNQLNCCDGVSQLLWDYDNSAEVVSVGSDAEVFVQADTGTRPITWSVRGKGCWTDAAHTKRNIVTLDNSLTIYTDEDACGPCTVQADDGCSTVSEVLRVTLGEWVYRPELDGQAMVSGPGYGVSGFTCAGWRERVEGRWKTMETVGAWGSYSRPSGQICEDLGLEECYKHGSPETQLETAQLGFDWHFAITGRPDGLCSGDYVNNDRYIKHYEITSSCSCFGADIRRNWEWVCP